MNADFDPLDHPLNDGIQVVEVDGQPVETINTWTLAAIILDVLCNPTSPTHNPSGLINAEGMARAAINQANPDIPVDELLQRCQGKDHAALRQAHSLIASGISALVEEQFK